MHRFALLLALPLFTADARAQDACAVDQCDGLDAAIRATVAEAGLTALAAFDIGLAADGTRTITLVSSDADGLSAVGRAAGARAVAVRGTDLYTLALPLALTDMNVVDVPTSGGTTTMLLPPPPPVFEEIVTVADAGAGSVGWEGTCEELCVSTIEGGLECWQDCW